MIIFKIIRKLYLIQLKNIDGFVNGEIYIPIKKRCMDGMYA